MRRWDAAVRRDGRARRVATVVGVVFVLASLPKFLAFGWERDNFERFGLPVPEAWVVAAGVLELLGGAALLRRRFVLPAVALLAVTMLVAIVSSGVLQGDVVPSLTVAPALLGGLGVLAVRAVKAGQSDQVPDHRHGGTVPH